MMKRIMILSLVTLMTLAAAAGADDGLLQAENEELRKKVKALQEMLANQKRDMDQMHDAHKKDNEELAKRFEAEAKRADSKLNTMNQRMKNLRYELDQLQKENESLKAQLANHAVTSQVDVDKLQKENKQLREQIKSQNAVVAEMAAKNEKLSEAAERALPEIVQANYSVASDRTRLSTPDRRLTLTHGSVAATTYSLEHTFKGKSSKQASGDIKMLIQAEASGGIFRGKKSAKITLNGKTHELKISDYDAIVKTGGSLKKKIRRDNEFFTIHVPADVVRNMTNVREVPGNVGPVRFKLIDRDIQALREMLQKAGG